MASIRRVNFRNLFNQANNLAVAGAFERYSGSCNLTATSIRLALVRHSSVIMKRARKSVLSQVPEVREMELNPGYSPLTELSIMPNYKVWHRILTQLCPNSSDRYVPAPEWERIFKEFLQENASKRSSFFGAMMSIAGSFCYQALGDSLLDYLHESKTPVNITVASRYLKLCGRCVAPDFERKILDMYDELKRLSPANIYDSGTAENLIAGLYQTSKWEECIKLLDMMDFSGKAGPVAVSYVIVAAFANNSANTAMRLLKRLKGDQFCPSMAAFSAWFQWAKRQGYSTVKDMLVFTKEAEWYLPFESVKELRQWMEKEQNDKWIGKFTTISSKGECKACQQYMEPITINKQEFEKLRENFIKAVIEGTDVFLHTNPAELQRYRTFIEKNAPFDLVIDGLNIAYHQNSGKQNARSLSQQLRIVIEHLLHRREKKILVLGRVHMRQWPNDEMSKIASMASLFFADNVSQDDPFVLYGALHSGLGCTFLSGDLMRDHRFKLSLKDDDLRKIFLKWQRTHQMQLLKVYGDATVRIQAPMKYDPVIQWTDNSIHIPYHSGLPLSLHELPSTWLCLIKDPKGQQTETPSSPPK